MIDPGLHNLTHAITWFADNLYLTIPYQATKVPVLPSPAYQWIATHPF